MAQYIKHLTHRNGGLSLNSRTDVKPNAVAGHVQFQSIYEEKGNTGRLQKVEVQLGMSERKKKTASVQTEH